MKELNWGYIPDLLSASGSTTSSQESDPGLSSEQCSQDSGSRELTTELLRERHAPLRLSCEASIQKV